MNESADPIATRLTLLTALADAVRCGLIVLDGEKRIILWNSWMVHTSSIPKDSAVGKPLERLFPDLTGRVRSAIDSALESGYPSVLSQSLNKSPFPLYAKKGANDAGYRIKQAIEVVPMDSDELPRHCLIQIADVTAAVAREDLLRIQAVELRQHTYLDGLTGIANRRRLDEYLESELRRSKRSGFPLSLIMIDIDHFKTYNDTYGHQAGDRCMVQVASTFSSVLHRPADLVARYGGEEFAIVLPDTDIHGAMTIAETMRKAVAALGIENARAKTTGIVTVSLGVATAEGWAREPADLIAAADGALYTAKHEGRNRICVHDPAHACGIVSPTHSLEPPTQ